MKILLCSILILFVGFNLHATDLNLISINVPEVICNPTNALPISITVKNNGPSAISSYSAGVFISGPINSGPHTDSVNQSIAANGTKQYTFSASANISSPGKYTISCWVILNGDTINSNDSLQRCVQSLSTVSSFPYKESFENGDGGWFVKGSGSSWFLGKPNKGNLTKASSGQSAWVNGGLDTNYLNSLNEGGYYNPNEFNEVASPCFDFTSLDSVSVEFDIWHETEFGWDGSIFQYSTNNGGFWNNLATYTGSSNGWQRVSIPLNQLAGLSGVRFRFPFASDGSTQNYGLAFDNVLIGEPCNSNTQMTGLSSKPGIESAKLFWDPVVGASLYEIRGKKTAPVIDSSVTVLTVKNTLGFLNVFNLSASASYEWQMRVLCDTGGVKAGPWSAVQQFTNFTCDNPTNTLTTDISTNSAKLNWNPISYTNTLGYRIFGGTQGNFNVVIDVPGANASLKSVNDLLPANNYNWGILAACFDNGNIIFSDYTAATVNNFTTSSPTQKNQNVRIDWFYPNPVKDIIHLKKDIVKVKILMSNGSEIYASESDQKVNVSSFPGGLYVIQAEDIHGNMFNDKFIVL
ncbi:MAG: hypothetical protein HKN92_07530 [Chitinophagales bacterium]|nr:hypothetical protein [Chitinophagales bacterium]